MAIDPRIPLMGQGLERRLGPMDYYAKAAQLQSLAQQNRLADFQMQQAQRALEDDRAQRAIIAQSGGDWGAASKSLAAQGYYKPAMEIESWQSKRTKEGAEAEKEKRLATRMRIEDGARLLFSAKDQPTYDRARATAIQREIAKADEWPDQFDPNFVSQQVQEAQTVKDLIDQGKPMTEIGKLLEDMRKGKVPQGLGIAAANKMATHAPPQAVISMGSPTMMVDASGNPVMVQPANRPGVQPQITPLPGLKPQPTASQSHLTEGEAKATMFYSQMDSAEREIKNIVRDKFDPASTRNQIGTRMAQSDWTNWLAPKNAQRYAQSTEQWAEAYLRLKTGAATTKDEIKRNARAYFPQPGDSMDVIKQKNAMRRQAIGDVSIVAGRGMEKIKPASATEDGWGIEEVK